jgi:hypothetical protein
MGRPLKFLDGPARLGVVAIVAATGLAIPQARATLLPVPDALQYAVLYEGTGGHNLSISNVMICGTVDNVPDTTCNPVNGGNVGVGGTGAVQFSGPGTISGVLNFSAANSGQFHNTNGSNVGPASVNYNVTQVTTALNEVNTLSSSSSGGTSIAFTNPGQTINESSGQLQTINGVATRVFNVSSYSANNATVNTIVGDGTGDPVAFNFAFGSNVGLGGSVVLSGLVYDQVLWNFTSTGKNISLTNNGETFQGDILASLDALSIDNATLVGRFWGGNSSDMQVVSGAKVFASPAPLIGRSLPVLLAVGGLLFGVKLFERSKKHRFA